MYFHSASIVKDYGIFDHLALWYQPTNYYSNITVYLNLSKNYRVYLERKWSFVVLFLPLFLCCLLVFFWGIHSFCFWYMVQFFFFFFPRKIKPSQTIHVLFRVYCSSLIVRLFGVCIVWTFTFNRYTTFFDRFCP